VTANWRDDFEEVPLPAKGSVNGHDHRTGANEGSHPQSESKSGKAQPFKFWRISDIKALKPPEYVVEGLIPARAQSVLFAPSGHYKTT